MQSKTTLFIIVSVVVVIVAVLAMTYWPESDEHKASKDLLGAAEEATGLWHGAEELLGTPVFLSPDGQHWPDAGPIDQSRSGDVRHGRPQAVNPEALARLTSADKTLTEAIERCAAAAPADRAAALRLSARIDSLTALYHERDALVADVADQGEGTEIDETSTLDMLLNQTRRQVDELNHQVRLLDSFAGEGDDDISPVQTAYAEAKAEREEVFEAVRIQRDEIKGFEATIAELTAKIETLSKQASDHRAASRAGETAADQLASLTKAQAIEAQIEDARDAISAEERKIELGQGRFEELTVLLGSAETRVQDLAASLERVNAENRKSQEAASDTQDNIKALLARLDKTLGFLNTALANAAEAQEKATLHREEAIASLLAAGELDAQETTEMIANQASAHTALAALLAERVRIQERVVQLVEHARAVCDGAKPAISIPGGVVSLPSHVVDSESVRKEAASQFVLASDLFSKAADSTDPEERPVLQAEAGIAQFGLYRMSGEESALKKAQQLIKTARSGAKDGKLVKLLEGISFVSLTEGETE